MWEILSSLSGESCFDSEDETECRPQFKRLDEGLCGIKRPFISKYIYSRYFFENLILVQIEC
jgi:hypothetical protein